jgi:hypothetical protein
VVAPRGGNLVRVAKVLAGARRPAARVRAPSRNCCCKYIWSRLTTHEPVKALWTVNSLPIYLLDRFSPEDQLAPTLKERPGMPRSLWKSLGQRLLDDIEVLPRAFEVEVDGIGGRRTPDRAGRGPRLVLRGLR